MIKVFWILLWAATILFGISYFRMRDQIPIQRRDKIEIAVMIIMIIVLLANIFAIALERKEVSEEMNDCIRFYRYFPEFLKQDEFNFLNKCYDYFDDERIKRLRDSGFAWKKKQVGGWNYWAGDLGNFTLEGGESNE